MRIVTLSIALLLAAPATLAADCVVLLHGLARTSHSMSEMESRLREAGYVVENIDYPSRDYPIEKLAPMAIGEGIWRCRAREDLEQIHFVAHSLGGILVRKYLENKEISELGRVVMLGPPNQGSAAVDELGDVPGFDWVNGPAGRQLGKGEASVPLALGPADFELGVIAGSRTIDPIGSSVLEDPDDGKVSVADTRLEGMDDFIVVKHSHAFLMRMELPIDLTLRFLETGSFSE